MHRILSGLRVKHAPKRGDEAESSVDCVCVCVHRAVWQGGRLWTRSRCAKFKVTEEEVQQGVVKPGCGCVKAHLYQLSIIAK